jgi:hypothetical protein
MRKGKYGRAAGCEQNVLGGEQNSNYFDEKKSFKKKTHYKYNYLLYHRCVCVLIAKQYTACDN